MPVDLLEQLFQRELLNAEFLEILVICRNKPHIVLKVADQVFDEGAHDNIGISNFRFHRHQNLKGTCSTSPPGTVTERMSIPVASSK